MDSIKKLYIVQGNTGEYDDYTQWNVAAFLNREDAEFYLNRLTRLYLSLAKEHRSLHMQLLDPRFQENYNGTSWTIDEVELRLFGVKI